MSTVPHPALARWLRLGGTAAHSAAAWRATQDRLDGLAAGLGSLPLLNNPWRGLDTMPWAVGNPPGSGMPAIQDMVQARLQARLQALLQLLSPATAGGAALPPSEAQAEAELPGPRPAPMVATGTQPAVQGAVRAAMSVLAAGQALPAASGQRPVPAPPRQPAGPPRPPIAAAAAAAQWQERATRAGLDTAFHSPLAPSLQPGPVAGLVQPMAGAAASGVAGLARQPGTVPGWTASDGAAPVPQQKLGRSGAWTGAAHDPGGPGKAGARGDLVRPMVDTQRPGAWTRWADDASGGPVDQAQGRAVGQGLGAGSPAGGLSGQAWPQATALPVAAAGQPWAGVAPWASGADAGGQVPRTGLRGLAQRASQALAAGAVQPAAAGGQPAGPFAGLAATAPAAPTQAPAGLAAHGSAGDGAARNPADDQQLLLQLARVLRREAERDGIDLSDTAA